MIAVNSSWLQLVHSWFTVSSQLGRSCYKLWMVLWVLAVAVAVAASKQAVLELALRSNEEGQLETSFSLGKSEVRGTSG